LIGGQGRTTAESEDVGSQVDVKRRKPHAAFLDRAGLK
jgi:hypothetical protein